MAGQNHRGKFVVAGLVGLAAVLVVAVLVVANQDDDSSEEGRSSDDPPVEAEPSGSEGGESGGGLTTPDSLIVLSCDATAEAMNLVVTTVAAEDGQIGDMLQVDGPGVVTFTDSPCDRSPLRRHRFNADFSQIGVLVPGPGDEGSRAVAVELYTGEVVGPSPDPEAFASSPSELSPGFDLQSDELWYIDSSTDRVVSRPPDAAASEAVERGPAGGDDMVTAVDGTLWVRGFFEDGDTLSINPSGTHGVIDSSVGGMSLWAQGTDVHDAVVFPSGGNTFGRPVLDGEDVPERCEPALWIDDHNVVCNGSRFDETTQAEERNLFQITLSDDYTTVTDVVGLLPATDRTIDEAAVSPDGTAIAFVSEQGNVRSLYRQDLVPGAEPTRLADLASNDILMAWV